MDNNNSNQPPVITPATGNSGSPQQPLVLPNSTAVLVLGIISIVSCWCYGVVGLTCGIIALVLASKGTKLYRENPGVYSVASYNNMNAGKICAIIGTVLSSLTLLYVIFWIVIMGAALSSPFMMMGE